MIIAISGLHGTGKSTIGELLSEQLQLEYYSTGNAFRELAKKHGKSLKEFTAYVEQHPEIDKELDDYIVDIAKKGNIVVDSQLSGHILKDVADIKFLFTCPINVRVERMAKRDGSTFDEKLEETTVREQSELERFKILYDIDLADELSLQETFDYIISTEHLSIDEVLQKVISLIEK